MRFPRSGLTLVEVVAGLTLLSTLLTTIIVAYGLHLRQIRQAQKRIAAVREADRLLFEWFQKPDQFPEADAGGVPEDTQLHWRTRGVDMREDNHLDLRIVRLEVFDGEASRGVALAAVDVVVAANNSSIRTEEKRGAKHDFSGGPHEAARDDAH